MKRSTLMYKPEAPKGFNTVQSFTWPSEDTEFRYVRRDLCHSGLGLWWSLSQWPGSVLISATVVWDCGVLCHSGLALWWSLLQWPGSVVLCHSGLCLWWSLSQWPRFVAVSAAVSWVCGDLCHSRLGLWRSQPQCPGFVVLQISAFAEVYWHPGFILAVQCIKCRTCSFNIINLSAAAIIVAISQLFP